MAFNSTLFKQPKLFWALAFGELWSTFSYFGTQTILALYFIRIFHLSTASSYLLYGAYASFAYSIPILGGIIADKGLGSQKALILGSVINIIGNFMLMSFNRYFFCLGLATTLIGSGLYKSNLSNLVGGLYPDGDTKKEQGFTLVYLFINVGGMLGPLIYGLLVYSIGWNYGFLCSALGSLMALIWFISSKEIGGKEKPPQLKGSTKNLLYFAIVSSCFLLSIPFYLTNAMKPLIFAVFMFGITYLIVAVTKYSGRDRSRLIVLLLISFFALFYFAAGLQIGTSVTLFIQHKIQQGIINTHLPASIFSTLYPLFVLILAPFFTYFWHKLKTYNIFVSTPTKLAIGMLLAALGMVAFAFGAVTSFVMTGIILGNLLLSAGELALTPAVYTAISDLSPVGMKSTMMGSWLLFIALGGYLSSVMAGITSHVSKSMPFHQYEYATTFLFTASFTFVIALIFITLIPRLLKMIE